MAMLLVETNDYKKCCNRNYQMICFGNVVGKKCFHPCFDRLSEASILFLIERRDDRPGMAVALHFGFQEYGMFLAQVHQHPSSIACISGSCTKVRFVLCMNTAVEDSSEVCWTISKSDGCV